MENQITYENIDEVPQSVLQIAQQVEIVILKVIRKPKTQMLYRVGGRWYIRELQAMPMDFRKDAIRKFVNKCHEQVIRELGPNDFIDGGRTELIFE